MMSALAGYSGTPLAKKLGITAGCRMFVTAAPENYAALLAPLPQDVRRARKIDASTDLIHMFCTARKDLERGLKNAVRLMRSDAIIWVSWPKKASGVATDITEDTIREIALPMGLVDVKVSAVSEVWSGLKLVVRRGLRNSANRTS
jgi:hypothetical protein